MLKVSSRGWGGWIRIMGWPTPTCSCTRMSFLLATRACSEHGTWSEESGSPYWRQYFSVQYL